MNIDPEIQIVRADSNLPFEPSAKRSKMFKGKKLNKYLPTSVFFSKKPSAITTNKKIDFDNMNTSLKSMCSGISLPDREKELTHVGYVPTTHNSVVLIASLPRSLIFMDERYKHLSMRDIKCDIAKILLSIPENPIILEQQARKGRAIYDFKPASYNDQQPIQSSVENTIPPSSLDLKTWDSSIIYIKKYFTNLSSKIYDVSYKCGGAMCIESNVNLLSQHELYELKKNDDMKAILETKSVNKKYNFSIYANSVITGLTKSVYLNFFNIPEDDFNHILQNPDINSLELKQCNAK